MSDCEVARHRRITSAAAARLAIAPASHPIKSARRRADREPRRLTGEHPRLRRRSTGARNDLRVFDARPPRDEPRRTLWHSRTGCVGRAEGGTRPPPRFGRRVDLAGVPEISGPLSARGAGLVASASGRRPTPQTTSTAVRSRQTARSADRPEAVALDATESAARIPTMTGTGRNSAPVSNSPRTASWQRRNSAFGGSTPMRVRLDDGHYRAVPATTARFVAARSLFDTSALLDSARLSTSSGELVGIVSPTSFSALDMPILLPEFEALRFRSAARRNFGENSTRLLGFRCRATRSQAGATFSPVSVPSDARVMTQACEHQSRTRPGVRATHLINGWDLSASQSHLDESPTL